MAYIFTTDILLDSNTGMVIWTKQQTRSPWEHKKEETPSHFSWRRVWALSLMGWISTDDEFPFLWFQMVYLESDTLLSIGDVIYDTLYFWLCELCASSSTIQWKGDDEGRVQTLIATIWAIIVCKTSTLWLCIRVQSGHKSTCRCHDMSHGCTTPPHEDMAHFIRSYNGEEPDANLQANISALLLRRPMITQCITGTGDIVAQQLRERGSNTTWVIDASFECIRFLFSQVLFLDL